MLSENKILLVEDDDSLRGAISTFLGVHNDVEEAGDFASAKNFILKGRYDLVLLDKGLPDGDGIGLVRLIRESSPETAVIIMTGQGDYNAVSKCISTGADDYIVKSENLIPDLLLRIPVALSHASLRHDKDRTRGLLTVGLPSEKSELSEKSYRQCVDTIEKAFLENALSLCGGDVAEVARRIGLAKSTVFKKMMEFGIARRPWNRRRPDFSVSESSLL